MTRMKTSVSGSHAAASERYRQAMVDADIESLARDPRAEQLAAEMDAQGLPLMEQIERLKAYFREFAPATHAAE